MSDQHDNRIYREQTSNLEDGGPAFPVSDPFAFSPKNEGEAKRLAHGMTLRDYFAAKALAGMIISHGHRFSAKEDAGRCYAIADAMLCAREAS
ncbi:hypothetical protein [Trinickia mobilis]|uniref:hypothetical protein n=1 Tax=Trinickia mobilis TaxID=2816356 RepID=UPI001A8F614E|nr:hypothetical protein [Trinickia mobilis]